MQYLNTGKGIKKIRDSQFIAIIASLLTGGTALLLDLFPITKNGTDVIAILPLVILGIISMFASLTAMIVTLVLSLVGYRQIATDEPEFRKAFLCAAASGALSIVGFFFQIPNGTISTILTTAGTIVEMFVIIFAISGFINLFENCECPDMAEEGDSLLKVFIATYIITAINALIIRIFELSSHAKVVSNIFGAIDLAVIVLRYVLYLKYLKKTENMLVEYQNSSERRLSQ